MIQLQSLLDNSVKNVLKEQFMSDLRSALHVENFNLTSIITKEYFDVLVEVIRSYMFDVIGIKLNNVKVFGYIMDDELPVLNYLHIKSNKCCGLETAGFYNKLDKTVYIEINKQLKCLIPTLFHELMHVYIDENNIIIVDNYPKPTNTICFDFASKIYLASQEEGICELASSLMCLHIFDTNQYPSNVEKYWLGWRLCVQAFIQFAEIIKKTNNDNLFITKMAFKSTLNMLIKHQNIYHFVDKVPKDAYFRTNGINLGM